MNAFIFHFLDGIKKHKTVAMLLDYCQNLNPVRNDANMERATTRLAQMQKVRQYADWVHQWILGCL
jgi:hypothetical protein